jgi:hypothetical protein
MIDRKLAKLTDRELQEIALQLSTGLHKNLLSKKYGLSRDSTRNLMANNRYGNNAELDRQILEEAKQKILRNPKIRLDVQSKILSSLEDRLQINPQGIPRLRSANLRSNIKSPGTRVIIMPCGYDYYYSGMSTDELLSGSEGIVKSVKGQNIMVEFGPGKKYGFRWSELRLANEDQVLAGIEAHNKRLVDGEILSQEEFKERVISIGTKGLKAKKRKIRRLEAKMGRERYSWMAKEIAGGIDGFKSILSDVKDRKGLEKAITKMTGEINRGVKKEFKTLMKASIKKISKGTKINRETKTGLEEIAQNIKFSNHRYYIRMGLEKFRRYINAHADGITKRESEGIALDLSRSLTRISDNLEDKYDIGQLSLERILGNPKGIKKENLFPHTISRVEKRFDNYVATAKKILLSQISTITNYGKSDESAAVKGYVESYEGQLFLEAIRSGKVNGKREYFARKLQRAGILGKGFVINVDRVNELISQRVSSFRQDVRALAKEKGFDLETPESTRYVYIPDPKGKFKKGNLDPYRIGEEFINNLLRTAKERASTNREKNLIGVAKELIINKKTLSSGDFKRALSKPVKIWYDTSLEKIGDKNHGTKYSRQFRRFSVSADSLPSPEHPFNTIPLKQSGLYLIQRDLVVEEMITALSQGAKKGTGGIGDDFRIFWERYNPAELDLHAAPKFNDLATINFESQYSFQLSRNKRTLAKAINISGACLGDRDIEVFTEDPGTLNLIAYNSQEEPIGYTRYLLSKENKGEATLAIDTMEVGHKMFNSHWDWMRAMSLATIQLGLDTGIKYVVGNDGRVVYGPRQAFGNLYRNETKLSKIGESMYRSWGGRGTYCFNSSDKRDWSGKTSILFRNWNNSKPKSKKKKSKAKSGKK